VLELPDAEPPRAVDVCLPDVFVPPLAVFDPEPAGLVALTLVLFVGLG
jgi:hypothetical protein